MVTISCFAALQRRFLIPALAFLLGLGVACLALRWQAGQVRFVACSPDSVFRLEAVKTALTPIAMPGHGGDGGGRLRLIDNYSRRIVQESPYIPQISSFGGTSYAWKGNAVEVKIDADPDTVTETWPLTRE